jgi:hypothetical protein
MFVCNRGIETGTCQEIEFPADTGRDLPLGNRRVNLVFLAVFSRPFASF